jgi:ABC-type uncharacterized transport system substrate-binding protein
MRRREFITLIGGAVAWPLAARAQQPPLPVIGFLGSASPDHYAHLIDAYRQGLTEAGYDDGRNVTIDFRWAESQYDRLPALAADLVHRRVAVITAGAFPAAVAAKAATTSIPIVFSLGVDPVEFGLVTSMNRPGGNITGVANLNLELGAKQLEVLRELASAATVAALLINPTNPNAQAQAKTMQGAAGNLGLRIDVLHARSERDFDPVIAAFRQSRAAGLVIGADSFLVSRATQLGALLGREGVPAIMQSREFVMAGGLLHYGSSITDAYRRVGVYTGRVLKGEKPADLPVQQSTKVELIVNLKVAKAMGLNVPQTLLARADEMIE